MDDIASIVTGCRNHLDFLPMAYYPYTRVPVGDKDLNPEDWLPDEELAKHWRKACEVARAANEPGRFVVFPGYEWQGAGLDGDHNVFFFHDDPPFLHCDRLSQLYAEIRDRELEALAIPHHTAYKPGVRSKNWDVHDEALSPFAEIFSHHGCSETDEENKPLRRNWNMGPGVSGGTISDGLARGLRLGIIASNDAHGGFGGIHGDGVMACYAPALTRKDLWEAFKARHVYGVTGDRIALEFHINDAMMGDELRATGAIDIRARVTGSYAVDRIELLRDERVVRAYNHQGTWAAPRDGLIRAKARYEMGWGPRLPLVPELSRHRWEGEIRLSEGVIRGVEKCFRRRGQEVRLESDRACRFDIATPRGGRPDSPVTDAIVLEFEAPVNATLDFVSGGARETVSVLQAMSASAMIYDEAATARMILDAFGARPQDVYRRDQWYFLAYKVKRYRAIPQAGYRVEIQRQEPAAAGRHCYRVRVEQTNGQYAWSSPIWIEGR